MLSDASPTDYSYTDATSVLVRLGYELAPHGSGSHRKWRRKLPDGAISIIGLVEKGSGTLKPYLIRDMVRELRRSGLVASLEGEDDDVDD